MSVDLGYCQCGCGDRTKISDRGHTKYGHVKGMPFRFIRGHENRGRTLSREARLKLSMIHKRRVVPERELANLVHRKGSDSHFWRGGVSTENELARKSTEYRAWRQQVFNRDNFTCQACSKRGGVLHPHHIRAWAVDEGSRFIDSNGATLCQKCHTLFHQLYGKLQYSYDNLAVFIIDSQLAS